VTTPMDNWASARKCWRFPIPLIPFRSRALTATPTG